MGVYIYMGVCVYIYKLPYILQMIAQFYQTYIYQDLTVNLTCPRRITCLHKAYFLLMQISFLRK